MEELKSNPKLKKFNFTLPKSFVWIIISKKTKQKQYNP